MIAVSLPFARASESQTRGFSLPHLSPAGLQPRTTRAGGVLGSDKGAKRRAAGLEEGTGDLGAEVAPEGHGRPAPAQPSQGASAARSPCCLGGAGSVTVRTAEPLSWALQGPRDTQTRGFPSGVPLSVRVGDTEGKTNDPPYPERGETSDFFLLIVRWRGNTGRRARNHPRPSWDSRGLGGCFSADTRRPRLGPSRTAP